MTKRSPMFPLDTYDTYEDRMNYTPEMKEYLKKEEEERRIEKEEIDLGYKEDLEFNSALLQYAYGPPHKRDQIKEMSKKWKYHKPFQ